MPPLHNVKHEQYCQLVASGVSKADAYVQVGYSEKPGRGKIAYRLNKFPAVVARITELQTQTARKARMTRDDLITWLERIIKTGSGDVTPRDELCQSHRITDDEIKVNLPDKLAAAAQLAKLCKWNPAESLLGEMANDDELTMLLVKLRGSGKKETEEPRALHPPPDGGI